MTRVTGDWLERPATRAVCTMLENAGHRALFVGGCVRDALLGRTVADIDISTDARPERVMELATVAGMHAIPTGIDHGTVTVVSGDIPHEVTTFRRDVETDGRRAVVAFADTVDEDALRRDFTMNALYADIRGEVSDPLEQGIRDLRARRIRFIQDPDQRIREDYLRILRFFRFHAWYGDPYAGMDEDALAAIVDLSAGIDGLSRERVGHEMLRLLAAPDPAPALAAMQITGVLSRVLPGADPEFLAPLVHVENQTGTPPDPIRRLAVLGGGLPDAALRLSKADAARRAAVSQSAFDQNPPAVQGYRLGEAVARDALLLASVYAGQSPDPDALNEIRRGALLHLPVRGRDLTDWYSGKAVGDVLDDLEHAWVASNFTLTRDELLERARPAG